MKKIMFCLAVAGMFAFAACNNGTETKEGDVCNDTTNTTIDVNNETTNDVNNDTTAVPENLANDEAAANDEATK